MKMDLYMPSPVTSMDVMLYFDLGGFVQDGLAMRQTFNIKGASGDKFCMLCSNIRAISLDLPPDTPEEDIPGSHVTKLANCILSTDQEVLDASQVCKEKSTTLSKKQFELWEKACGITFSHHALLLNQTLFDSHLLKPISGYIHDWMHTMASQGVIQRSTWLLLSQVDMWDQTSWSNFSSCGLCQKLWPKQGTCMILQGKFQVQMHSIRGHWPLHHAGIPGKLTFFRDTSNSSPAPPVLLLLHTTWRAAILKQHGVDRWVRTTLGRQKGRMPSGWK